MELEGQVALVTGAAQGIGEAIALALASAGADVVINDVNEERAKATAVRVRELGRRALPRVADVSRGDAAAAVMGATVRGFGHPDILVHNAGLGHRMTAVGISETDLHRAIDV